MGHRLRLWIGDRWHLVGGLLLLVYFAYHGLHGDRGLYAWVDKARELELLKREQGRLEAAIDDVAAKVAALQPDRGDPDLIEERLRMLGWIARSEVIILSDEAAPAR